MAATPLKAGGRERASLLGRLAAWWEGVDAAPPPFEAAAEEHAAPRSRAALDLRRWSAERLEAAQSLYGEGWIAPGGEAVYGELIKTLSLDASQSVVVHGAGLGGAARMIARETDAWVDAQEEHPLLAAEAMRQVKAHGLAKKVAVLAGPLEGCGVKPRSRHAVISFESLYRTADKRAAVAALREMLKPGGQVLLADFVRKDASDEAIERWARCEPTRPHFSTAAELKALLEGQGLDVRVFEDRSQAYCRAALHDLQVLLKAMETSPVRPGLRGWLIWEIEVLTQKLQALDSGAIGLQRIFALVPAAKIER